MSVNDFISTQTTHGVHNLNMAAISGLLVHIADMLYSGHLVIADTFSRNGPNHGQTLIEIHLYIADSFIADTCYSGHIFSEPREHLP